MKTSFFLLLLFAVFLLSTLTTACSGDDEGSNNEPANTVTIYEDPGFGGRSLVLFLQDYNSGECIDLHSLGFADNINSITYDLKPGVKFEVREHQGCQGRILSFTDAGTEASLDDEEMDNLISSALWR